MQTYFDLSTFFSLVQANDLVKYLLVKDQTKIPIKRSGSVLLTLHSLNCALHCPLSHVLRTFLALMLLPVYSQSSNLAVLASLFIISELFVPPTAGLSKGL